MTIRSFLLFFTIFFTKTIESTCLLTLDPSGPYTSLSPITVTGSFVGFNGTGILFSIIQGAATITNEQFIGLFSGTFSIVITPLSYGSLTVKALNSSLIQCVGLSAEQTYVFNKPLINQIPGTTLALSQSISQKYSCP